MAVKPICFHLPQFHRIPENDRWWGEGFTEWTLVRQAQPLFPEHHQPNRPHPEIGYYNLLDPQVRKKQGELARDHGVFGFCYYHYWFEGKKLLERPLELMLQDGYPDIPFCLNWANETWSRRWYGTANTVLQPQEYGDESDWREHFAYLCRFFRHPNYIKVHGNPVFLIYRIGHSHVLGDMLRLWRREAVAAGLPGMYFVSVLGGSPDSCLVLHEIDAVCEFFPPYLWSLGVTGAARQGMIVQTVEEAWRAILQVCKVHPVQYRGAFHSWDNTPRRPQGQGVLYLNATPKAYEAFLDEQIRRVVDDVDLPESFLFVNAWNEWGEGACLEPDEHWGRGYLEAFRSAVNRSAAEPRSRRAPGRTPRILWPCRSRRITSDLRGTTWLSSFSGRASGRGGCWNWAAPAASPAGGFAKSSAPRSTRRWSRVWRRRRRRHASSIRCSSRTWDGGPWASSG
jgi:hypothetical protein